MSGHRLPTRQRRHDRVASCDVRKNRAVGCERLELGERQLVAVMHRTVPTQAVQLGRLRQADRFEEIGVDDREPGTEYAKPYAHSADDADRKERRAASPSACIANVLRERLNKHGAPRSQAETLGGRQ